ncbi:TPA: hypothetical protein DCZ46_03815 [Candidatus Campbellbacteria bacterium]|uniref:Vitamin K epoxide reductase domain-containing protein n=2 Tax=Candidatus Campbelliibacteriota TaxID=1752727 RepID=A0A1F5EP43_9BACT|nr:MAG: protein of unknown function with transmembrane region [Candidatus Campbellbacteria bacterium GW2011_OD1_34_28]OGD68584.1 MAG: hypothetical protein A2811_02770 [Candidatus Campbellbacteria bacterium RIFCSPHIGHO2_01_FULL_34_10]OGD69167.1 MAG: hypothetical protein A2996_01220 [Candidatus Campbellbacteria bacterium RIFCSPLOWO2_01_FULL_34_15]HAP74031.1 hypothetical protein [Candidatus Campbellbacteria bacterium]HAQ01538.1 hypothetical protein [Candidatus Campbellbacteria bacterium]
MELITSLEILIGVLTLGTIYAWYQFYQVLVKRCDTCSVGLKASPFRSKCFVGAIFFTTALLLAIYSFTLV